MYLYLYLYLAAPLQYVFRSEVIRKGSKQKTVHEELAKHLTSILRPANADMFVIMRLLSHSRFFFEMLLKSMTQYLIDTERIKVSILILEHMLSVVWFI